MPAVAVCGERRAILDATCPAGRHCDGLEAAVERLCEAPRRTWQLVRRVRSRVAVLDQLTHGRNVVWAGGRRLPSGESASEDRQDLVSQDTRLGVADLLDVELA
jgi:hypothetical protein